MRPRRGNLIWSNPVLVGAVTTLVVVIGVFLAYHANSGLPFVPTYDLRVELPDAGNLVVGNDVRIAGTRVGIISRIAPHQDPQTGAVHATLTTQLDRKVGPLAADSTVIVRSRSALGLKYLELTPGSSRAKLPNGSTLPLSAARPEPVEIDQLLNTFDAPTRAAAARDTVILGDALAGRGASVNDAIGGLASLLRHLEPVASTLAAPQTRLGHLFVALDRTLAQLAPLGGVQARLARDLDATFAALATVARPQLGAALEGAPAALRQATRSFAAERPFLANATGFVALLRPSVAELRGAAPALGHGIATGAVTLQQARAFDRRLTGSLDALAGLAGDQRVALGLEDLADTARLADPLLATLTPEQTACNYLTLFFRNVASLLSEGDSVGAWSRFVIVLPPGGPNNEGVPSAAPANGPAAENHLHANPYPSAASCEAGNEGYKPGATAIGNVPGGGAHEVTKRDGGLG